MLRDDITVKKAIMHILDPMMGEPVISGREMEPGAEVTDFFRLHIENITENDDVKKCEFYEDSDLKDFLSDLSEENFAEKSMGIAGVIYDLMDENPDIPSGDLACIYFECKQQDYMALLKMDYRSSYTHYTDTSSGENINEMVKQRATWPVKGQKLSEACVISLEDGSIRLIEKPYDVNGEKINYFSRLILQCHTKLSEKTKLQIVEKAVAQVNREEMTGDEIEDAQTSLDAKARFYEALNEPGGAGVSRVSEKVFGGEPEKQEKFIKKVEEYAVEPDDVIAPKKRTTVRKYERQTIKTDTGIVISIPMDKFRNSDIVEFEEQHDGSINIIIKNISKLITK
ncbi:MAG: nucleoid-associated protein [Lachnospiraceae bacterium]|nr:nucleoid-associated protein [Lachnospiraceae bacterium]